MIEEVVNSILQAEDVAEKKIAKAKAQANEIVMQAEVNADAYKKQHSAETKTYFAQQCGKVDTDAAQVAKQRLFELNQQTDKETAGYEKNIPAAVKIILEQLL